MLSLLYWPDAGCFTGPAADWLYLLDGLRRNSQCFGCSTGQTLAALLGIWPVAGGQSEGKVTVTTNVVMLLNDPVLFAL